MDTANRGHIPPRPSSVLVKDISSRMMGRRAAGANVARNLREGHVGAQGEMGAGGTLVVAWIDSRKVAKTE